jgi:hypothetical protein
MTNCFADMAPSWSHLKDALVACGCVVRIVADFDEMANLGFKERIEIGPSAAYVKACKRL